MSMLSHQSIIKRIKEQKLIENTASDFKLVGPSSVDLRLGRWYVDMYDEQYHLIPEEGITIYPHSTLRDIEYEFRKKGFNFVFNILSFISRITLSIYNTFFILGGLHEFVLQLKADLINHTPKHKPSFILASTMEIVNIPDDLDAFVQLRSTAGRMGVQHALSGKIDSGYSGEITLEFSAERPVIMYAGKAYTQISFTLLDEPTEKPYRKEGRYMNQRMPVKAKTEIYTGKLSN